MNYNMYLKMIPIVAILSLIILVKGDSMAGSFHMCNLQCATSYPQVKISQQGETGPPGPRGDKGELGLKGSVGNEGSNGYNGVDGIKGRKGNMGNQGIQGIMGIKGSMGIIGMKGAPGVSVEGSVIEQLIDRISLLESQLTNKISRDDITPTNKLKFCGAGLQLDTETYMSSIEDTQFTASTFAGETYAPHHGRLFASTGNGGWSPSQINAYQYLQVDLGEDKTIYGIVTQGRHDGTEFVTSYVVSYQDEGSQFFQSILDSNGLDALIFEGNVNAAAPVTNIFPQPIRARYFEINPRMWSSYICVRFELLTC